ncbi:MAG TPA: hypothetical protein VMR96_03815, partial [Solirubrobacterales bacterium]|nr:hypothetical protein [Solirubrobacterales bacterium]
TLFAVLIAANTTAAARLVVVILRSTPSAEGLGPPGWQPRYLDYLYVAFTNVVAFSPTDTMPLTHRVKELMAVQSMIALSVIGLVLSFQAPDDDSPITPGRAVSPLQQRLPGGMADYRSCGVRPIDRGAANRGVRATHTDRMESRNDGAVAQVYELTVFDTRVSRRNGRPG